MKGYCDGTWETHHTNYILHADCRLNSFRSQVTDNFFSFVVVIAHATYVELCQLSKLCFSAVWSHFLDFRNNILI